MNSNRTTSLIIGLVLIGFAFLILISLLTKLSATSQIVEYWPAVLILIGVLSLNPKSGNYGVSLGLIFFGIFGALRRFGAMQTPAGQTILALMLGFAGLIILVMLVSRPKKNKYSQPVNRSQR